MWKKIKFADGNIGKRIESQTTDIIMLFRLTDVAISRGYSNKTLKFFYFFFQKLSQNFIRKEVGIIFFNPQ